MDDELRVLQREAAAGDPEAKARLERRKCRRTEHAWMHYKGGAQRYSRECGAREPKAPRELGNETVYGMPPFRPQDLRLDDLA